MPTSQPHKSRVEIRNSARQRRRGLSQQEQQHHAAALKRRVIRLRQYRYREKLAFYLPNDGEIDPQPIIEHAWSMKKSVYLPVLSPLKDELYFTPYVAGAAMVFNRFGILEPERFPDHWLSAAQIDTIFLPLVAFDSKGNRLGMGGGFYDRSLSYLSHRRHIRKPQLVGLAHGLQQEEDLDSKSWDIPLNYIVTESQTISI